MPYSFQAAGLTGPTIIAETKEDGKSTFNRTPRLLFVSSQPANTN